jgi:endonuclease-3
MAAREKSASAAKTARKSPKKTGQFDKAAAAERVRQILPILKKTYPNAGTALYYTNPLELLIATILSAQCTDARVNLVTPALFKKYRSAEDWARADLKQIEQDIKSCGFYHNKAVSIQGAARKILDDYKGKVPRTMDELVTLPGVGRKTANCVLGNAYGQPAIMCDTHVIRLSRRLQLSPHSDPVKLEFDLADIVPKEEWTLFCHMLIAHGRAICKARKPDCPVCPIAQHCPAANNPALW